MYVKLLFPIFVWIFVTYGFFFISTLAIEITMTMQDELLDFAPESSSSNTHHYWLKNKESECMQSWCQVLAIILVLLSYSENNIQSLCFFHSCLKFF